MIKCPKCGGNSVLVRASLPIPLDEDGNVDFSLITIREGAEYVNLSDIADAIELEDSMWTECTGNGYKAGCGAYGRLCDFTVEDKSTDTEYLSIDGISGTALQEEEDALVWRFGEGASALQPQWNRGVRFGGYGALRFRNH